MKCPNCNYVRSDLDAECPRCRDNGGLPQIALEPHWVPPAGLPGVEGQQYAIEPLVIEPVVIEPLHITKARVGLTWHRLKLSLVAAVILVTACSYVVLNPTAGPEESAFPTLYAEYGIQVDATVDSGFFPSEWRQPPISARVVPIRAIELRRFSGVLKTALAKYPREVIRKNLKTVCVAQELYFYDTPYGGTNSTETIYLTSDGWMQGFTDDCLVGMFHHEFSSILMRNHPFPKDQWLACNPPGFRYRSTDPDDAGAEAIRQQRANLYGNTKLYNDGFLAQYSTADIEDDVNVFSEYLLTNSQATKSLIEQYPRLKMKYQVWLDFYRSIDDRMTESFLIDDHR